jgi:hypothetical protein
VRRAAVVFACWFAAACGDDADASARPSLDAAAQNAPDAGPDAGADAADSGYGDGVCTEREFMQGNEAIEISMGLAAGGPGLVSAYFDRNRAMLDGIWEDCMARLCPVVAAIFAECASNFVDPDHDDDGGLPPGNPCGAAPPECDPYL